MERTGILHSVCSYKEQNQLTCELSFKGKDGFALYRCIGSLYSQARALEPGQEVTILHEAINHRGAYMTTGLIAGTIV